MDKRFFIWLKKNGKNILNLKNKIVVQKAICQSCSIKAKIIEKDEHEKDLRMILNFGHTFAHGFEGAKNYSKKINHGDAVLMGMLAACELSYKKKLLPLKDLNLIREHYFNLNLPKDLKKQFKKEEVNNIVHFMQKDKKNMNEKINLVLIKKIGKTTKPNECILNSEEIKSFLLKSCLSKFLICLTPNLKPNFLNCFFIKI